MLDLLHRCFPDHWDEWEPKLKELIPTMGSTLNDQPKKAAKVLAETSKVLGLDA
jgi:malate dehydrogenase (quinone)